MRVFLNQLLRRPALYVIALVLGIVFLAVFIRSRAPENPTPAADPSSAEPSATFSLAETGDFTLTVPPELFVPIEQIDAAPAVKLKSYARKIQLQIVDSEDLSFDRMARELLDLNPTQVEHVNNSLKAFVERLRLEEVAHASVAVGPDGNEEIVISAFDRGNLVSRLRDEISKNVDADVAAFIADQLVFDSTLAIANSEIRVAIETGDDGADRLTFTRKVQRPEAVDENTPFLDGGIRFAPTWTITTAGLLGPTINSRFAHLFAAVEKLPRRTAPVLPAVTP